MQSPTALHFDCETKKEMCDECTSALWADGARRWHHIVEWGLRAPASMEDCLVEKPKKNLHGTEAGVGEESWGRTSIAAFEQWRQMAD